MKITSVAAPAGADSKYQFFKDETGQTWKATIDTKVARPTMIAQADVDVAPAELALVVTVSPVDDKGKALRDGDKPIIIDTKTHTITDVEMAAPDFDINNRIGQILTERVELGQARLKGHAALVDYITNWNSDKKIKLDYDSSTDPTINYEATRIANNGDQ